MAGGQPPPEDQRLGHVGVGDPVDDSAAPALVLDEAAPPQTREMVRNTGGRRLKSGSQLRHGMGTLQQQLEDADSVDVAKDPEEPGCRQVDVGC